METFEVLVARASETEPAAHHRGAVAPRQVEPVRRLREQVRFAADAPCRLTARGDHVGRCVDAVHVEPARDPRHEQTPTPTRDVECGLTGGDVAAEEVDLRAFSVEVRPPAGNQAVMPCRHVAGHGGDARCWRRSDPQA